MVFGKLLECVRGRPKLLALNNLILAQAQSPAILCWLKKCRMDMAYESPPPPPIRDLFEILGARILAIKKRPLLIKYDLLCLVVFIIFQLQKKVNSHALQWHQHQFL